ncbi:hypothetical protein N7488_002652 [Penicillium malachiteum]|nr:hypothetical protein N7488_002652 [Penicillium malachiteum]
MASLNKTTSPDSAPPSETLQHDLTLRVAKSVTLTLGADSLVVAGRLHPTHVPEAEPLLTDADARSPKSGRGCCGLLSKSKSKHVVSLYNIVDAQVTGTELTITYAVPGKTNGVTITPLKYPLTDEETVGASKWVGKLLDLAYKNSQQRKRLKILINPCGGKSNAVSLYETFAAPVFAAARCEVDVQTTEHQGHATEIVEKLDANAYDAVVCCSGDGLVNEVFQGFGKRPDARAALAKTAVALLPGGSANALTLNCFADNHNVSFAALAIVKGIRTPLDLVSVSQADGSRFLSFLFQATGIVAEADLHTDHLRWMGEARFLYGFFKSLLAHKGCPCDLAVKVVTGDKQEMKDRYAKLAAQEYDPEADRLRVEVAEKDPALPELKYGGMSGDVPDDWTVLPGETLGIFMAGNVPTIGSDKNFFPATWPNDGLMDVLTIDNSVGRWRSLDLMDEIPKAKFFDRKEVNYHKALAYRLIPRYENGAISVDGEGLPFEAFQCEIHQGLATILTKSGTHLESFGP